jgi:hypothetical protein
MPTATALVFKFCGRNPTIIRAVAVSSYDETPDKITELGKARHPRG